MISDLSLNVPIMTKTGKNIFDAVFFDITLNESSGFTKLYDKIRPHVRQNGKIYLNVINGSDRTIPDNDIIFCESTLPDKDISTGTFNAGRIVGFLRKIYTFSTSILFKYSRLRLLLSSCVLMTLAPICYIANSYSERTSRKAYGNKWLNMFAEFTVIKNKRHKR